MKFEQLQTMATIEISGVDKKTKENETPVKLCNFIDVYHNWAITSDNYNEFMSATAKQDEINSFKLKKGQVAITKDSETRDDIGISTYIAEDFDDVILGYHTALITPDENKLDGAYLNAFMHSKASLKHFENNASGSGQRYTLSDDAIKSLKVLLPETIDEQKRISKVLTDIDKKIALNKKINNELEAMAKELFDYWFLQFDFPNKNGRPYKSSGGNIINNEVLKRNIPEGWEVKPLGEILSKIDSGKRPAGGIDKKLKTGIPSLGAQCIDKLGHYDFSSTPYISEEYRNIMTSGKIESNDILIYKDGAYVGKTTLFRDNFPYDEAYVNEHVFLIHAKEEYLEEYVYYTLNLTPYFQIMQNLGKAKAAQPGLNREDLQNIILLIPNETVLKKFHEIIEPLFKQLFSNSKEIGELLKVRDELLPLLMNGQITIKK